MDIIVTIPKSEMQNIKREVKAAREDPEAYFFWTFNRKPKVVPGDKIFFVSEGQVIGSSRIFAVEKMDEPMVCDVTERDWPGDTVVKFKEWNPFQKKVEMKGFRGYRYVENLPRDILERMKEPDIMPSREF